MNNTSTLTDLVFYTRTSKQIQYFFIMYCTPIGIFTNFLTVLIFSRKTFHNQTNMGLYNMIIATSNIITLFYYMLVQESELVYGVNMYTQFDFACRFLNLLRRSIRQMTPLVECVVTTDRFLDVFYPNRFRTLKTKRAILTIIICVYSFYICLNSVNLFYEIYERKSPITNQTVQICSGSKEIQFWSDIIATFLRTYFPMIIMIVFNVLIVYKLKKSKSKMATKKTTNSKNTKENRFTMCVTLMNLSFTLLNLPISIMYVIRNYYVNILDANNKSMILINFYFDMFYLTATLYYMIFFFLNLFINQLFRKEFINSVFSVFRFENNRHSSSWRIQPSTQTFTR
jgi:hypothetical protein